MSLGIASLQTAHKKEPTGSPFSAGSANNGLSVDAVTGKIVLGNDTGDALMPAQLVSDRQIVTNSFFLRLIDSLAAPFSELAIFDQRVLLTNLITGANIFMELNGSSPQFQANASAGNDANWSIFNGSSGASSQTNGITPFFALNNPTTAGTDFRAMLVLGVLRIRDTNGGGNGLDVDGTANDVASTGTLSTAQPSANGAGKWNLGKLVVAASVPDATQYIEIMVDGVLRKVVIAV